MKANVRSTIIAVLLMLPGAAFAAAPAKPATPPQSFATPEKAADALIAAAETFDVAQLTKILGSDGVDLVVTDDTVQDKKQASAFAERAKEKTKVVRDSKNPKVATVLVGTDEWPSPIPIVQKTGGWVFDTKSGRQELLYRRVGSNELDAISICHGYVEAQHEYASERHDGSPINQYAQHVISTEASTTVSRGKTRAEPGRGRWATTSPASSRKGIRTRPSPITVITSRS